MKNSSKKLTKLSVEAYLLLHTPAFAGFVRACQLFGVDVYPTCLHYGVFCRTSKFLVERYRDRDGFIRLVITNR